MAYVPNSGSVVAYQIVPSSLLAGVSVMGLTPVAVTNIPSISGTVNIGTQTGSVIAYQAPGSILATSATVNTGNSSVQVLNFPTNQNVSGSVVSFQGTTPWTSSVAGAVQIAGASPASIATVQRLDQQVIGSALGLVSHAVIHGLTSAGGGNYVDVKVDPSGAIVTALGSVVSFQAGTQITSLVSTVPSSVIVGASIFGLAPVNVTNTNLNVSGSVAAFINGTNSSSVYGMRNDAVASFLGADLTVRPISTDSAGRGLGKPFAADESRLDTVSSTVSTSVTALFNSVVGLRLYVTDIMVANTGSVATLVTFKDGSTSVLGYTIAPAGGGSNINGMAFPMRTAPAQDFTFNAGTATSVLYVTAKGYKAP